MKKIGFVIPWFSQNIPGGAEMELRGLTLHLHQANYPIEILTTCVKEFSSDWNIDFYKEGTEIVYGITVRRFKVRKRDEAAFHQINAKLMKGIHITIDEEQTFLREMVNSTDLYSYIEKEKKQYSLFVFIPYMFGTTYFGAMTCLEKAVIIPCLHDESYAYMKQFRGLFSKVKGMIFHAKPEAELAAKIYDLSAVETNILGEGVNTDIEGNKDRFLQKYKINTPFILYAGRKDKGKNVDMLLSFFLEYKNRNDNDLKLVIIGGGELIIPKLLKDDVVDLGFVSQQDKYDAFASSLCLCQPSKNESFSLVIMESWLCGRPVLVNEQCLVTKGFAIDSVGGLYFNDYFDFEGCINYYINNIDIAEKMGESGRHFVLSNFSWDVIVDRYMEFFRKVMNDEDWNY